jgi:hypothetical protein
MPTAGPGPDATRVWAQRAHDEHLDAVIAAKPTVDAIVNH